jgi:cell fate regulator YaaT (PSP1 superfamily)
MELPAGQKVYDIIEVRFKNSRKAFYRNASGLELYTGDVIAVEASPGYDLGVISIAGELARLQVNRKQPDIKPLELKKVVRKATAEDIALWQKSRERENQTMIRTRILATELKLSMKISDVEYQADGTKATFFYTADDRVDFRQLIKVLADEFRVRVEMRQIGARQEAGRLGGIGSCGRELCCSTWLTDFRTVSTSAARYQQLSINPQKLAGQCGKLKCCLNYELDQYAEALKDFPDNNVRLETQKGRAIHMKNDIFRRLMWYVYEDQVGGDFIAVPVDRVKEVIALNKKNQKPDDLIEGKWKAPEVKKFDFSKVDAQDDVTRFDEAFKKKKKKKKKRKPRPDGQQGGQNQGGQNPGNQGGQGQGNQGPRNQQRPPRQQNRR